MSDQYPNTPAGGSHDPGSAVPGVPPYPGAAGGSLTPPMYPAGAPENGGYGVRAPAAYGVTPPAGPAASGVTPPAAPGAYGSPQTPQYDTVSPPAPQYGTPPVPQYGATPSAAPQYGAPAYGSAPSPAPQYSAPPYGSGTPVVPPAPQGAAPAWGPPAGAPGQQPYGVSPAYGVNPAPAQAGKPGLWQGIVSILVGIAVIIFAVAELATHSGSRVFTTWAVLIPIALGVTAIRESAKGSPGARALSRTLGIVGIVVAAIGGILMMVAYFGARAGF